MHITVIMVGSVILYYGVVETKHCRRCDQAKPVEDFYRNPVGFKGHRAECRDCWRAKRRADYAAGKAGRNKDVSYEQLLKRDYGITLTDYNRMLRQQASRCAICRRAETVRSRSTGEVRRLSVDHDHVTGAIRALLCQRCNMLVWAIEDNHTAIASIRIYVEEWRSSFANEGVDLLSEPPSSPS